jgi:hypothetical protein
MIIYVTTLFGSPYTNQQTKCVLVNRCGINGGERCEGMKLHASDLASILLLSWPP